MAESLKVLKLLSKSAHLPEQIDTADLEITDETVSAIMKRQPGTYAWIATLHATAKSLRKAAEGALKVIQSRAYLKYKDAGVKITEEQAKSLAQSDGEVVEAMTEVNNLTMDEENLLALREAYRDRKECVIETARDLRKMFDQSGSPSA